LVFSLVLGKLDGLRAVKDGTIRRQFWHLGQLLYE